MNLNIKNGENIGEIVGTISSSINKQLELGKKVLWFITGGSSIPMQILVAKKIRLKKEGQLVITLTDERYGEVNHPDSNWFKLISGGFEVKGAKPISILSGKDILNTTKDFIEILKFELSKADYKIGVFGIGADGHTAGILPQSEAIIADSLAYSYDVPPFKRVTITPKTILKLDEAFAYVMGENKRPAIDNLKKDNIDIKNQPAQVLKGIKLLTIFADYKK